MDLTAFKDGTEDRLLNVENFDNTAPLVKLWVCDNGPGIPTEVLPKIFQPYFTTKPAKQGTGLGLNIVHRLVKEAKGALHVHTKLGEGTTVHDLPAGRAAGKIAPARVVGSNCALAGVVEIAGGGFRGTGSSCSRFAVTKRS